MHKIDEDNISDFPDIVLIGYSLQMEGRGKGGEGSGEN